MADEPQDQDQAPTPASRRSSGGSGTEYAVYRNQGALTGGLATTLIHVANVTAENPTDARWKAVDSDAELKAAADADATGEPPALLVIATRHAKPVATREEKIVEVRRK